METVGLCIAGIEDDTPAPCLLRRPTSGGRIVNIRMSKIHTLINIQLSMSPLNFFPTGHLYKFTCISLN